MTETPAAPPPPPWAEDLARWRDALARLRPHPGAVAAALAAVAVLVVAAALVLRRPAPPPAVVLPRAEEAPTPTTVRHGEGEAGRPAPDGAVTVHAAGALVRPGVYVLPGDARVADAVAAAGGASPEADLDQLNLAARVSDGDRVHVPRKGEVAVPAPGGPSPPGPGAGTGTGAPGGTTRAQLLDLNTATADQLESLPGVGPSLAAAIVEHRSRNGRFRAVDDLVDVRGIGPAKLAALRPLVRV